MEKNDEDEIKPIEGGEKIQDTLKTKWRLFFRFLDFASKDDVLTRAELSNLADKLSAGYQLQKHYQEDIRNGIMGWWHVIKYCYGNDHGSATSAEFVHAMSLMYREQRAALLGYSKEFARVLFDTIDTDSDGVIHAADYGKFFAVLGYENEEYLSQTFKEIDYTGRGAVRRVDFQKAVIVYHLSVDLKNYNDYLFALPEMTR